MTSADPIPARARRVLDQSLVWDNHACMPLRPNDERFLPQLDRIKASGVDMVCLNVGFGPQSLEDHIRMLAAFRHWIGRHSDQYVQVETLADLDRARAESKLGIAFDVEGMGPLDHGDYGLVQMFYDLGVRWMMVAYNRTNSVGAGCYEDRSRLTPHGRRVLTECKRVGMVVCVSHTGHDTARDVFEAAENPVIFSSSNPSAIHPHTRNIPDDLIRACAATGGVVGINGIGVFLGDNDDRPETVVRHIDHVVQLVGPDHVALGLDYVFDGKELANCLASMRDTFPGDPTCDQVLRMVGPEAVPAITEGLLRQGYRDRDIAKILGLNWRRVAESVWR